MKIYFTTICGKGVGNLAILLKNQGHEVLGSEFSANTYYPPISDALKKAGIPVTLSFDPNEITSDIDLVIMGGAALIHDPKNPQVLKAKELGIETISYAEGVGRFLSKSNNIEVVGNHAKTTTTTLIAHILRNSGIDISYFIGGEANGFEQPIHSGKDSWSVCEGDEYPSIGQQHGGKFLYHNPKHVVFTSADWDHKNVYKTEEDYLETFRELFRILPVDGTITACLDGINTLRVLDESAKDNKINLYTISKFKDIEFDENISKEEIKKDLDLRLKRFTEDYPNLYKKVDNIFYVDEIDYTYHSNKTRFAIKKLNIHSKDEEDLGYFETSLIGPIGVENSLAATACLQSLSFDLYNIKKGVSTIKDINRKLELIYDKDYKVINDFAHSPIKIESALKALRTKYRTNKIFTIFQVNQGGLKERKTFEQLQNVFNLSNFVLISKVTPDMNSEDKIYGKDYQEVIKKGAESAKFLKSENVFYTPVITQMKSILENNLSKNDVIIIMGTGNISEFLELVKNLKVSTKDKL